MSRSRPAPPQPVPPGREAGLSIALSAADGLMCNIQNIANAEELIYATAR